jgi:hypothetical protein
MWFVFLLMLTVGAAKAEEHIHGLTVPDWYESMCCSNRDCHPVTDDVVKNVQGGVEVKGYGLLSYSDARLRWSRDNQNHICESLPPNQKLLCVYRKFNGT